MDSESIFTVAQGLADGVAYSDMRRASWDRSVHGVRTLRRDLTLEDRCRLFAHRMNGATFSHVTAALLHGMPLPLPLEKSPLLHIAFERPSRAPHVRGVRGHKLELLPRDVVGAPDLRVTSPSRTWCDMATMLTLPRLVALGDFAIHWSSPICTREQLRNDIDRFVGHRGVRMMRAAYDLLSDRSESPPESIFRVIALRGGLPLPAVNHALVDTETGRQVRPDFRFERSRTLVEYQGDYHRTKEQWRKDMTRRSRLEAMGWKVMEINWEDLKDPAELVARIRSLMAR